MGLLRPIVIMALTLIVLAWAVPGVSYGTWSTLLAASIILTILQKVGRPILNLLLLPINIVTLGLFSGVVNVIIMWLVIALVPSFHIEPITIMGHEFNYFFSLLIVSFMITGIQGVIAVLF